MSGSLPLRLRLKRAWLSANALRFFAKHDTSRAIAAIEAMQEIEPLSPAERLWKTFPLFAADQFEAGEQLLDDVCQETALSDDVQIRIVHFHARALRARINGDELLNLELKRQISELTPTSKTQMWLPLN